MDFGQFVLAASVENLDREQDARQHADAIEFRMDRADRPVAALSEYDGELPVIATNRAKWEGGDAGGDEPAAASEGDRLETLATVTELSAVEAVDVELMSVQQGEGERVVETGQSNGTAVIVSSHFHDGTPEWETLRDRLSSAVEIGTIGKLVTTAEDPSDVLPLLSVTRAFAKQGAAVSTMAMGKPGRHSRAVAPTYGSRLGYASVGDGVKTAPEQYDLETLSRLIDELGADPEY